MKIKRKILRKILLEELTTSSGKGISVKGMKPTKDHPSAIMVAPEDAKRLTDALKVSSRYKTKPQYVWKDANVGASEKLYLVGELTSGKGDPYTYNKVGDKYRVISGPTPKTIGKTFTLSKPPEVEVKDTADSEVEQSEVNILTMSLEEYKEYLSPRQKKVFDQWAIFSTNADMSLEEWFSKDTEIIKDNMEMLRDDAMYAQKYPEKIGAFRAPAHLIPAYIKGPNDKDAFSQVTATALDTIVTKELRDFLNKKDS